MSSGMSAFYVVVPFVERQLSFFKQKRPNARLA